MRIAARFCLLVATASLLLGMAASPGRSKNTAYKASESEAEDAALIAELDRWVEQAVAENYDFLQSLEILQDASPEKSIGTQEEAK